jgi:hypothetical protein
MLFAKPSFPKDTDADRKFFDGELAIFGGDH